MSDTRWSIVLLVVAGGVLATMQIGKAPPALLVIRDEFEVGMVTAGWIASIVTLTGAILGFATGIVSDAVGPRRIVLMALVCLVVGSVGGGMAMSANMLLVMRFLEGVGYIAVIVAGTPLIVAACAPRDMDLAMGLWSAYFPAGIGIMIALSAVFLESYGWRNMWYANAVLIVAFILVFLSMTRGTTATPRSATERQTLQDVRLTLSRAGPWLLAVSFMALSTGSFSMMTWLPTFLIESLGHTPTRAAIYTAIFAILYIPPNVFAGWILSRPAIKRWYLLAIGGLGLGVLPMGIMGADLSETVRIVCAIAFVQLSGLIPGAVFAGVPAHAPTEKQIGAVTGVLLQGNSIGVMVGPPLIGVLVAAMGGWAQASWVMVIVGAIALAAAFGTKIVEDRAAAEAGEPPS